MLQNHILFSFYLSEVYFTFYILCFVILCCFSVIEIDVAFLFFGWLLQLLEEKRKKKKALEALELHTIPHTIKCSFLYFLKTLLLSVLFPPVQMYII